MNDCKILREDRMKQCCCNCYFRAEVRPHMKDELAGYACVMEAIIASDRLQRDKDDKTYKGEPFHVTFPWPEHSVGCEMYWPIEECGK